MPGTPSVVIRAFLTVGTGQRYCLRLQRYKINLCLPGLAIALLSGCAGVSVQALTPNLAAKSGQPGLVYYMPSPYLLVAELPPTATGSGQIGQNAQAQNPANAELPAPAAPAGVGGMAGPAFNGPGAGDQSADKPAADTTPAPNLNAATPASDSSFSATTAQYVMKIIYLPDHSRPMAMTASDGLFGTSEMKPVLQDGWMLVSLDATSNTQVPEALTALSSLVGSALGVASGTKAVGAAASKPGGGPQGTAQTPADLSGYFTPGHFILRPGLYGFEYNPDGTLHGLSAVAYFTGCGAISPNDPNLAAVLAPLMAGIGQCPN